MRSQSIGTEFMSHKQSLDEIRRCYTNKTGLPDVSTLILLLLSIVNYDLIQREMLAIDRRSTSFFYMCYSGTFKGLLINYKKNPERSSSLIGTF